MDTAQAVQAAFPSAIWIVLAVCAVLSAVGFYKFVYFLSVGYGFAVSGAGVAIWILYGPSMGVWEMILCLLLLVYGIRLGGFLLWREIKSASYRKTLNEATGGGKPIPIFVKVVIWVCVAVMYVLQVSPVFYRAANGESGGASIAGAVLMALALVLESLADKQKSAAKKENPHRACTNGCAVPTTWGRFCSGQVF